VFENKISPVAQESSPSPSDIFYRRTLLIICASGSLLLLGWLLKYSAYGFDFSDEGFYLNSMVNPFLYDYSHTQFGFILHPIYRLLEGDIVKLRQVNILITFGLAWGLGYILLNTFAPEIRYERSTLLVVSAGLASNSLACFNNWLLTPNYNSLALQALLLAAFGLLMACRSAGWKNITGWTLLGVAGWLAFMAKASTAVALTLGVLLYLLVARKLVNRGVLLAIITALSFLAISAILIDGSVSGFVQRLQKAVEFGQLLGSGHTVTEILRIDRFHLTGMVVIAITLIGCLTTFAIWGSSSGRKKWLFFSASISITFFLMTASLIFGDFYRFINFGKFQPALTLGLVFAAVFTGILVGKIEVLKNIAVQQRHTTYLFLFFPYIYAFGTNGNYWQAGSAAAIFWLFAGLIFFVPLIREHKLWRLLLPLGIATQTVTIMILQAGFEQPYRQAQPIRLNNTASTFGAKPSTLVLSESYAKYISEAILSAKNSGFETGTPIIDLSGQSPSLLYALGAESIGQAWNVGDYPGSLALAKVAFASVSCEKISNAWVLFEPDGPRSISNDLMHALGSAFPDGYEQIATWTTPSGAGGHAESRTQKFYKPIVTDEIFDNCNHLHIKSGT